MDTESAGVGRLDLAGADGSALWEALQRFDTAAAAAVISLALDGEDPARVADELLVPVMRRLGTLWRSDHRVIAVEHACSVLVSALLTTHALEAPDRSARRAGRGPLLLCAVPSDRHHLGVLMAAVTVRAHGWDPVVATPDTVACLERLVADLRPQAVLVGAQIRRAALGLLSCWEPPAGTPVVAGGAGFRTADSEGRDGMCVHHGGFAELPDLLGRLTGG